MPPSDTIIGLSVSGGRVQALVLDRTDATPVLTAIAEWENSLPMATGEEDGPGIGKFNEYLGAFLKLHRVKSRRVAVTIDTAYLFLLPIPFDQAIPRPEEKAHLQWELEQYFPGVGPEEFVTAVHRIERPEADSASPILHHLAVAVRRHDTVLVERLAAHHGLSVTLVDIDHFSAETALEVNYPDASRRHLALIGIKPDRLDISRIRYGALEDYRYVIVGQGQTLTSAFASVARDLTGVQSIVAYGPALDRELLSDIRRSSPILVEALNPLRHVNVSDSLRVAENLRSPTYRFAAAIGVALRRD